tara:strand:+ start:2049 stop:2189 length:141 start_codon:yes stop_codon:yes gene_type:complete
MRIKEKLKKIIVFDSSIKSFDEKNLYITYPFLNQKLNIKKQNTYKI